jgi:hypothetical protein
VKLSLSDLGNIGIEIQTDGESVTFICRRETARIESLFLREILTNEDFKIIGHEDLYDQYGPVTFIYTNLPHWVYRQHVTSKTHKASSRLAKLEALAGALKAQKQYDALSKDKWTPEASNTAQAAVDRAFEDLQKEERNTSE